MITCPQNDRVAASHSQLNIGDVPLNLLVTKCHVDIVFRYRPLMYVSENCVKMFIN